VVIGFPLLTALALQHITAAHSVVFIGLLPLTTASFGLVLGELISSTMIGPRPSWWFAWVEPNAFA
jgi:drug/metabolite transporter (DMT)-like permease